MNIKKYRTQRKWSQKKLANALKVSQQTVAKWESGKSYPRGELIPQIAEALKCTIEDLYSTPLKRRDI